jgi:hypothetical protein
MATNLTDVSAFTSPVIAPADGDTRNAASITQGEQPLADRTRFLLNASVGQLLWNARIRVAAVTTGIGVYIGAVESLLIGTSLLTQAAETEVTGTIPLAGVSSWYYVYAYNNAGALALQVSLDAPDAALCWKSSGDLTHRYLGAFRTDGSGNPIYMTSSRGHCRWMTAPAARAALSAGSAIAATSVACAAYAPPHARLLCVTTLATETGAAPATYSLFETTSGAAQALHQVPASQSTTNGAELVCTAAQAVAYVCSTVDVDLTIYVDGWRE